MDQITSLGNQISDTKIENQNIDYNDKAGQKLPKKHWKTNKMCMLHYALQHPF